MTTNPPPPGKELDLLIAEKVMGYSPDSPITPLSWKLGLGIKNEPYSTDIASAFQIVEKINREYGTVYIYNDMNGDWHCDIDNWKEYHAVAWDEEELPYAICLSALRAVGGIG